MRVALKDNVMLAGVPMLNGSTMLEGFVPRSTPRSSPGMLDAGGDITGKATASTSVLSTAAAPPPSRGMVQNPHKKGHSAGGSSAGAPSLVSIGEVDMAMGGDQGGSIRIPSCWCGIYGLKPT